MASIDARCSIHVESRVLKLSPSQELSSLTILPHRERPSVGGQRSPLWQEGTQEESVVVKNRGYAQWLLFRQAVGLCIIRRMADVHWLELPSVNVCLLGDEARSLLAVGSGRLNSANWHDE